MQEQIRRAAIGRAIRERRETLDIKGVELADALGISASTLSAYELGRLPIRPRRLQAIAQALQTTPTALQGSRDGGLARISPPIVQAVTIDPRSRLSLILPPEAMAEVTRWGEEVAQRAAASAWSEVETEHYPIPASTPPNAFVIRVSGRCMEPLIAEGDRVMVDRDEQASIGDVVLVLSGTTATLKRLEEHDDGAYYLQPDNPEFPAIELRGDGDARIVGVVIDVLKGRPTRKALTKNGV